MFSSQKPTFIPTHLCIIIYMFKLYKFLYYIIGKKDVGLYNSMCIHTSLTYKSTSLIHSHVSKLIVQITFELKPESASETLSLSWLHNYVRKFITNDLMQHMLTIFIIHKPSSSRIMLIQIKRRVFRC